MLYDVFYNAYNYWNTITLDELVKQTDPTGKSNIWLTPEQFKSITGRDLSSVTNSNNTTVTQQYTLVRALFSEGSYIIYRMP